jgi:restriction system protein
MLLLQDWASDDVLCGRFEEARVTVGHDPKRLTNIHLKQLLKEHFGFELQETYATNVFPFVKLGPMNKRIKKKDLERAAHEFALPQIEIVEPRFAICFGKAAFNAIAVVAAQPRALSLDAAIASPFAFKSTRIWCLSHPGQQGTNLRNKVERDRVSKDWAVVATSFRA